MNYVHEIIRRYFNRRYPRSLENKIQHWLCEDENAALKEEALLHCWNETETVSGRRNMKDAWGRFLVGWVSEVRGVIGSDMGMPLHC